MCVCYAINQLLDAADGWVARRYHQATQFGAVLDQVTDRLSTVCMLVLDSMVLPQFYLLFTGVLLLDLGGHWVHTFGAMLAGSVSHKAIPTTAWPLLKIYYESKHVLSTADVCMHFLTTISASGMLQCWPLYHDVLQYTQYYSDVPVHVFSGVPTALMFLCHASNEFVWVGLFVLTRIAANSAVAMTIKIIMIPTSIFCILKNITNVLQLILGAQVLAHVDIEKRASSNRKE